jgi:twinkle protein
MSTAQLNDAILWVEDHFVWLNPEITTLDSLLDTASKLHETRKFEVIVLDPWSQIDHSTQGGRRDDIYIGEGLRKYSKFARRHNLYPIVVAHPVKMQKDDGGNYQIPRAYDINGGAQWFNLSSYILSVHRQNPTVNEVSVYVQKVKYKSMGKIGHTTLDYEWQSGRLKEQNKLAFTLPTKDEDEPW